MHRRALACALGAFTIFSVFASLQVTTRTAAATLDQGWGTPVPLQTHHDGSASAPAIASSPTGTVFATWLKWDGLHQSVQANVFTPGVGVAGTGWGWPTRLDTSPYGSETPAVAADGSGNAIAVWQQWDEGKGYTIHASRYAAAVGWTGAVVIDAPTGFSYYPRIGMNSGGTAFAAWMEWDGGLYSVYAARFTPGGGWGPAVLLDTDTVDWAWAPDVAVDGSGNAMVVWFESDGTRYNAMAERYATGTGWLSPVQIDNSAFSAYDPRVGLDGGGNAIATWLQYDGTRYNAYANRFMPGGGWGAAAAIEASSSAVYGLPIPVSVDSGGEAIAVWGMWDGVSRWNIYANRYAPGFGWGATETLIEGLSGQCYEPQISEDPSGNAIAVFGCVDFTTGGNGVVWANRFVVGSGWTGLAYIQNWNAQSGGTPVVAVDATGNAVAVFVQSLNVPTAPTGTVLFSNRFTPSGGWGFPGNDPRVEYSWSGHADVPVLAVNDAGFAVAAWRQLDGPIWNAYASWYFPWRGWQTPTLLEKDDTGNVGALDVAINAQAMAIVTWQQNEGPLNAVFANRGSSGLWLGPEQIDTLGTNSGNSKVAIDPSGDIVIVYTQYDGMAYSEYARRAQGFGAWLAPELLESGAGDAGVFGVAMDSRSNILAAWQQWDSINLRLYASAFSPASGWSPETLVHSSTGSVGGPITLRMNAAGIAYAGWPEFDGSYWTAWTAKWIPATGWGVPAELDAGPGDSGQVVVQPNDGGTALAAWYHSNNGVWEVKAENNVYGWGVAPIQLSASGGEAAFPDVAVSHYGQYAIGWQEWDGAKWNVVVQRFDVFLNALSPATPIRAEDDYADGVHLGVDGAGDVFASWREGPQDGVLTPMANRYVIRDGTPSLTVFSPTPGLYNTGVFTIQGFTDPGAQIVIDGVNVVVDVSGYFVDVVTLPDGPHYFQILAYNAAGSYTVQNILVDVDTIAPPLTITSPLFGLTNVPNVWVSGTTEPGATVDVDGITATVDAAGNFGLTEGMVEGSNTFIVTATDPAGNSVMRTLRVTLDTIPPPLTIFSPAGGVTNNPTVIIAGQTEAGASVTINGAPVTPDAFGAFQQVIGEPDGYHAFTIAATDAAGNAATAPASITVDTTVPGLAITSPSTGLLTNRPLVTVTGTVDPAASVVVNGFVVANAGGTFSVPMPLAEGANTIRATATDPAGNTASATITVTLDTRAPNLVLTTPQNLGNGGFVITNNNAVAIAGTTEPGASVTINAIPVPVGPTGAFTYTITEPDGYHTFTIVATDAAGNVASTSITVAVDTTPPPLAVAAPADGLLTATPTVIVRGTTETGARVTVNGVQAVVDVNGAFAVSLVLAEGANTIRVDATDVSGNTAMDTRSVTLDRVPPVLVLTGPADGTLTNVRNVVVSGFTEPRATVMIDGTAVTVGGTGLFTRTVTLSDGPHVFDVLASDAAGNEAETLVTVTVDTVAPALAITSPASGAATTDGSIVVSGTSEAGAHLVVNGVAVNVASDGTFSARIALAPGSNPITAIATDAAGNSATAPPVTVTFNDPVPGLRNDLTNTQNSLNATKGDLATTQGDLAAARQSLSSLSTEALGLLALAAVALVLGVLQFVQIRGLRKQMMRTNPERERRSEPPST